jgi:1,2-diacylglycerol 3-alpha-glucosyltransferase
MGMVKSQKTKLIIFGTFSDEIREEMKYLINQDSRIRYVGWLNAKEVYDYLMASDAAIFPGTKSALWEQAIGSGLPIICKKWKGMDYVDVGGNVIFIDGNEGNEISQKIELLTENKSLYDEMKLIAETKGSEFFSYERISRQSVS